MSDKLWRLCVPTYRRDNPLILRMLEKDETLELYLCCRHEEIENGFYDKLASLDRVNIVDLGEGLQELGETRQRILEYCRKEDVSFCCMFDDGICNVLEAYSDATPSQVFNECCEFMLNDELSDVMIGFTFTKNMYLDPKKNVWKQLQNSNVPEREYFTVYPGQAIMINVKKAFEYGISYKNMNECGFEDGAFFGDSIKAGLVWGGRRWIMIDGVVPNAPKAGGSHHDNFKVEDKYDKHNRMCFEYLNMMGISIQKRYRDYVGGYCSFIIWDYDYFYRVLCKDRDKNEKIISSKFQLF